MLKERDMNYSTDPQRILTSNASTKMSRVVDYIDVDGLDSDDTGFQKSANTATSSEQTPVSDNNSATDNVQTLEPKARPQSKTQTVKSARKTVGLDSRNQAGRNGALLDHTTAGTARLETSRSVLNNVEGLPRPASPGASMQPQAPTASDPTNKIEPKQSHEAANVSKRRRRSSTAAGNKAEQVPEDPLRFYTARPRIISEPKKENQVSGTSQQANQTLVARSRPQPPLRKRPSTALMNGISISRVSSDPVINMSTDDDDDDSPPPKAVKLSAPGIEVKGSTHHKTNKAKLVKSRRTSENVAPLDSSSRKSDKSKLHQEPHTHQRSDSHTKTETKTDTDTTGMNGSADSTDSKSKKSRKSIKKIPDVKPATVRRRVMPQQIDSGSDALVKRKVRPASRNTQRPIKQVESSADDDDESDGTPGPPAALVWGKGDRFSRPMGIAHREKAGSSSTGHISKTGSKTKVETVVGYKSSDGAYATSLSRNVSAADVTHGKRPKYLECKSEEIGAWRRKPTSKASNGLSFDEMGNVKGYSSIMRTQMDIAIEAAELSRHTEYKETDREKLGVDDLTGDDVILDIQENAVLILDDNGDENESIYGYFVDNPTPASSTQKSRSRKGDKIGAQTEQLYNIISTKDRETATKRHVEGTTVVPDAQCSNAMDISALSKRLAPILAQAQTTSQPARVTRRSGTVFTGEKKGRTSEEMFQQIASRNESRPWNNIKSRKVTNEGNVRDAAEEYRLKEQSKKFHREQLQLERDVFGFDNTPYTPDFVPAESPEPEEEVEHNNHCSTCSFGGMLVMCEDCPKSFHLLCAEPPLHRVPKDDWLCCTCKNTKALEEQTETKMTRKEHTGLDSATPWDMLIVSATRNNPRSMELPYMIREAARYEPYTPWLQPLELVTKTLGKEEILSKEICTMCNRGGAKAPVLPCSLPNCPLGYHADCLTPPLTVSTKEKGWRCPAHVEHPLGQLARAGRLPIKPKNTPKSDSEIVKEFMESAAQHWKSRYDNLRRKEVKVVDELAQLHLTSVPTYEQRSILQLGLQQFMVGTDSEVVPADSLLRDFMEFCEANNSTHRVQRYLDVYSVGSTDQSAMIEDESTINTESEVAAAKVS